MDFFYCKIHPNFTDTQKNGISNFTDTQKIDILNFTGTQKTAIQFSE